MAERIKDKKNKAKKPLRLHKQILLKKKKK